MIVLHVDDKLITGNRRDKINETKQQLAKVYKVKDLGETKQFLGIDIKRDRKKKVLELSQKRFIIKILKKFEMKLARVCKTPTRTNQNKKAV